ncbi:glycerophosphodiester phosphodiesterase [Ferrimonas gelatinilytica]|uniref:Glycerophosphodiester phosphodiesterase n=1 Tax=Ferrimonas gelatinilytica TaxID=1255257 RepID=A0ABP9S7V4_9GAMM
MKIIAHRGASADAPENTLAAMELALEQDADAIELDVHCVEGELVVIHDRYLDHTTSGQGLVHNMTLAQLATLDAGGGQRVPTLWQVMQCVAGRCDINIELKGLGTADPLLPLLARAEQSLGFNPEQWLISSFHHPMLAQVKQARPELKIGTLFAGCPLRYAEVASELNAHSVHLSANFLDAELLADSRRRGTKIYVYTVDRPDEVAEMIELGVDGIFTNYPARTRALCHSQRLAPGKVWR